MAKRIVKGYSQMASKKILQVYCAVAQTFPQAHLHHLDLIGYDMTPPLLSATKVYPNEAINQPGIENSHWTVEIALPISKLIEKNPNAKKPGEGIIWRVNFSRVQWGFKVSDGKYEKDPCCQSCATPGTAAEDNWVWSKQGEVAMHLPEMWGILQFAENVGSKTQVYEEWPARCAAMAIYYAMKRYHAEKGSFTTNIEELKPFAKSLFPICEGAAMSIQLTEEGYEATAGIGSFTALVNEERYLTVSTQKWATSEKDKQLQ